MAAPRSASSIGADTGLFSQSHPDDHIGCERSGDHPDEPHPSASVAAQTRPNSRSGSGHPGASVAVRLRARIGMRAPVPGDVGALERRLIVLIAEHPAVSRPPVRRPGMTRFRRILPPVQIVLAGEVLPVRAPEPVGLARWVSPLYSDDPLPADVLRIGPPVRRLSGPHLDHMARVHNVQDCAAGLLTPALPARVFDVSAPRSRPPAIPLARLTHHNLVFVATVLVGQRPSMIARGCAPVSVHHSSLPLAIP